MKGAGKDISQTMTTTAGPVVVLAKNEKCKQPLLQLKLSDGTKLRETKPRAAIAQEADLTKNLQHPCKRIVSVRLNGIATWKVKCYASPNRTSPSSPRTVSTSATRN